MNRIQGLSAVALTALGWTTPVASDGIDPNAGEPWRTALDRHVTEFDWDRGKEVLRARLAANPRDADAWRALGRLLRWEGRLEESRVAYGHAMAIDPDHAEDALAVASTYALDRDRRRARELYAQAANRWPADGEVREAAASFARSSSPRIAAFAENDLSFDYRSLGATLPIASRQEATLEWSQEERPDAYVRQDVKLALVHPLGREHDIELGVRRSDYDYEVPVTDFAAIDKYSEFRARYSRPLNPAHVATVRYSYRPTELEVSGDSFAAHKLEASVRSQWTPRLATVVGTGGLYDLDGDARSTNDMRTTALVRAGIELRLTERATVGASYITNPDLDNTVNATRLAVATYQITQSWSSLLRWRYDDYKSGADQQALYLGARFSQGSHPLWAEFGVKSVERGRRNGTYPLVSVIYRF